MARRKPVASIPEPVVARAPKVARKQSQPMTAALMAECGRLARDGLALREIADRCGVSVSAVRQALLDLGVSVLSWSARRQLARARMVVEAQQLLESE